MPRHYSSRKYNKMQMKPMDGDMLVVTTRLEQPIAAFLIEESAAPVCSCLLLQPRSIVVFQSRSE